jgi:SAM-dependent methyltransferase
MSSHQYPGTELDIFAHARNWKAYLKELIAPYLRGHVLEVGAGIGATTEAFRGPDQDSWTALEPDPLLARQLHARIATMTAPVDVVIGSVSSLPNGPRFDCVLYVDVLEHIEDDAAELTCAYERLAPRGAIVVLSPAHQALFSAFDAAIGHYRRYNRQRLMTIAPRGLLPSRIQYVDSVGLLLSGANRLVLRSAAPSLTQVLFWDRWCIPVSRRLDRLTRGRVGKSILAVWRNRDNGELPPNSGGPHVRG